MAKNEIDEVVEDLLSIVTDALASVCVMADRYNIDNDSILKYLVDTLTAVQNYEPNYTNADRIRSMSVEELAEWITNICDIERHEKLYKSIYNLDTKQEEEIRDSYGDLLKWLQSEAEQEDAMSRLIFFIIFIGIVIVGISMTDQEKYERSDENGRQKFIQGKTT